MLRVGNAVFCQLAPFCAFAAETMRFQFRGSVWLYQERACGEVAGRPLLYQHDECVAPRILSGLA